MMKGLKLLSAFALIALSAPALADHDRRDSNVNERQYRLEQRVEHGRRTGELTRHEYRRLQHELRLIARDEHAYRADGRLSPGERHHLHARLDAVARAVRHEIRDGERRYGHYNDRHYADRRF